MEKNVWISLKGMETKWRPNLSFDDIFFLIQLKIGCYKVSCSSNIGCPSSTTGCPSLL